MTNCWKKSLNFLFPPYTKSIKMYKIKNHLNLFQMKENKLKLNDFLKSFTKNLIDTREKCFFSEKKCLKLAIVTNNKITLKGVKKILIVNNKGSFKMWKLLTIIFLIETIF